MSVRVSLSHPGVLSKRCKQQAVITNSLLWAATRTLVFCDKISCLWVRELLSNEGAEERYPLKTRHFTAICSSSVKKRLQVSTDLPLNMIVISIDDLKPLKYEVFEFFNEDRPGQQDVYDIFSIQNVLYRVRQKE